MKEKSKIYFKLQMEQKTGVDKNHESPMSQNPGIIPAPCLMSNVSLKLLLLRDYDFLNLTTLLASMNIGRQLTTDCSLVSASS